MAKFTVNGVEAPLVEGELSYEEVAKLAGKDPQRLPTITYLRGSEGDARGTLTPGQTLELVDGIVLTAVVTDSA
jgi:hypothetical protein